MRRPTQRFGGNWTEEKLDIIAAYLHQYTKALKDKPSPTRPFVKGYIDAFAGTGYVETTTGISDHTSIFTDVSEQPPYHDVLAQRLRRDRPRPHGPEIQLCRPRSRDSPASGCAARMVTAAARAWRGAPSERSNLRRRRCPDLWRAPCESSRALPALSPGGG